ncbi:MAG: MFS transporter [Thermoanaerobaculia bacterium]
MLRALRHRNYRLFFFGQLTSLVGSWMQTVAQSWLVYRLTGSALLLGVVAFASQAPVVFASPIGGVLADRFDRRRMLIWVQFGLMIPAVTLAVLTLTDRIEVGHVIVLASLLAVVYGIDIPVRQSFVVEMVGREDLVNAIGLNSSIFNGARVIGPAIAGILVATVGEGWCFAINAVSFVPIIACLVLMRIEPRETRPEGRAPVQQLLDGLRFTWNHKPIRAIIALVGVGSFTASPYVVLMPIIADRGFHSGPRGLGMLAAAGGIGAVVGALTLASRRGIRGLGRWAAIGATAFGASLIAFAFAPSLYVAVALLLPVGFFAILQLSSSNTLVQAMVPDELRGRVMSLYSMVFMGMAPLGSMVAGTLGDTLGAPGTIAICGTVAICGGLVFARYLPVLRAEAQRLALEPRSVVMPAGAPLQ